MLRRSRCSAWVVGLAVASLACAAAVQAGPRLCAPCADAQPGDCCDHDAEEVASVDPHTRADPSEGGHCECSAGDCTVSSAASATISDHDVVPIAVARTAAGYPEARAGRQLPRRQRVARGPPKRTVVLLR